MHIHFNHHISCIGDIMEMIGEAHPDVTMSASHARADHGLDHLLSHVTLEMAARADGGMPDGYVAWLMDTASREGANVVIPYRHRFDLAMHQEAFSAQGQRLVTCGSHNIMSMIEDKPSLLNMAESLGLRISPFKTWMDADGFTASLDHFGTAHTLCVKPTQGIYGEGFRILYDEDDADAFATVMRGHTARISTRSLHDIVRKAGAVDEMMTMPFLPGIERSVDFACIDGRLLGAVVREKHGTVQRVGRNDEAIAFAAALVPALGLSGLANLQTLETADGQQCLLEINSRAAGGIGMTRHAGVNLPGLLVSALRGDVADRPIFPTQSVDVGRRQVYTLSH